MDSLIGFPSASNSNLGRDGEVVALFVKSCEPDSCWAAGRAVDGSVGEGEAVRSRGGNDETRSGNRVYMKQADVEEDGELHQ